MADMKALAALAARMHREQARADATRAEVHAAILAALDDGERQVDIAAAVKYTRERLRQLALKRR